ncbi:flagellar hook protein FlgE [Kushneria konosiri]|uniref:Flagellar hook protein FlgE n=1 Tax=Kushneria konosiri TaxID=698828 RepID=A0A2Z2HKF3_9GAMM|nr:flagellar hook protein FlgE [Kushneria konosiri]ARS54081.1 hypothetical protein B9G99_15325 [Kushneria konosiri]
MAFTQGVSGLNAASSQLDTIGHNIANSQTVGYKKSRTEFADLYAGAKAGLGVQVSGITQGFAQGALETTDRNLDLAIDGGGFFRLTDGQQVTYSRNGQFQMDANGFLVNNTGGKLMGYPVDDPTSANPVVLAGAQPVSLQVAQGDLDASATTSGKMTFNLDSTDKIRVDTEGNPIPFNANDPKSYNWQTSLTTYDSQGNAQQVSLYFVKTDTNTWEVNTRTALANAPELPDKNRGATGLAADGWQAPSDPNGNGVWQKVEGERTLYATVEGAQNGAGGIVKQYSEDTGSTLLNFGSNGQISSTNSRTGNIDGGYSAMPENSQFAIQGERVNGATMAIRLDAKNGTAPVTANIDLSGISQNSGSFVVKEAGQNGYAAGSLTGISVAENGDVMGNYSNNQSRALGRVALASFTNEQGLKPDGNNGWVATGKSGQELLGSAGTGQLGSLLSGTLENSNVDLAAELVTMIVAQRNYQANAQTIKTQDQILQTMVNLR